MCAVSHVAVLVIQTLTAAGRVYAGSQFLLWEVLSTGVYVYEGFEAPTHGLKGSFPKFSFSSLFNTCLHYVLPARHREAQVLASGCGYVDPALAAASLSIRIWPLRR